jgi:GNAT superfamily N-acetyltransferase
VSWSVSDGTVPEDTERVLATRGATLRETYRILAYDLSNGLPELDLADDVVAVLVQDASSLRAAFRVNSDGWNSPERSEDEFAAELARMARELETWSSFRVLASIAGEPVATGGCTMTGDVAHLLGSVTLPAWRRRGAYRAVLAERLRLAAQHGGTMAVVKGRVETSAPLLLRAGFHVFGEERRYRLPVV